MKSSEFNWDKLRVSLAYTANPAAGAQPAAITVPASQVFQFRGGGYLVTTDANIVNRYPFCGTKDDGTNYHMRAISLLPITASLTAAEAWFVPGAASGGPVGSGLSQTIGIAPLEVDAAGVIQFGLASIQVGDDIGVVYYKVKKLIL